MAMRRDGATARGGRQKMDARTHLLHEVLARTPLRTWTGRFGRAAAQILAMPSGPWAPLLFTGWSRAAMAQRDHEWMAALINWALAGGPTAHPFRRRDAAPARPAGRSGPLRAQTTADRGAEIPPPIRDASVCCASARTC